MSTTPTILVTGGTGTLGRQVVPQLREAGHAVRVLSRHERDAEPGVEYIACDLLATEAPEAELDAELDAALRGVGTVLHLAGGPKGDEIATARLVRAAQRACVRHLVYISVIGADRVPVAWMRSKLASEQAVTGSGIPYTILRAAQFHELVLMMAQKMAKLPVLPAPGGLRFQPVDSGDVAARLVELTLGEPAGLVADLAGPRIYALRELNASYLATRGKHRPMLPVHIPGKAGKAYRAGENLTLTGAATGRRTWEEFLAAHAA